MSKVNMIESILKAVSALVMAGLAIIKFIGYIVKMKKQSATA